MRYENWDVLAFPVATSAPLPEYSTKCFAIHDNALRAAVSDEGQHASKMKVMRNRLLTFRSWHHSAADLLPSCFATRRALPDLGAQLACSAKFRL